MAVGVFGLRGVLAVLRVVLDSNAVIAPVTRPGPPKTGTIVSGKVRLTKYAPTSNAMVNLPVCCNMYYTARRHGKVGLYIYTRA